MNNLLSQFTQHHAWFKSTIPSTGQDFHYRATVMKENMDLSLALSDNQESGLETGYEILGNCIKEDVNLRDLPIFDFEWVLLLTQKKAQGEEKEVSIACGNCGETVDIKINIDQMQVKNLEESKGKKVIKEGSCFIELKYPTMKLRKILEEMSEVENKLTDENQKEYLEKMIKICAMSIDKIYNDENVVDSSDVSVKELEEFILSMDTGVLQKFVSFFETMPRVSIEADYACSKCHHIGKSEITELNNFF